MPLSLFTSTKSKFYNVSYFSSNLNYGAASTSCRWRVRCRNTSRTLSCGSRCRVTNAWGGNIRSTWWPWRTSWRGRWTSTGWGWTKSWKVRGTTSPRRWRSCSRNTRRLWTKMYVDKTFHKKMDTKYSFKCLYWSMQLLPFFKTCSYIWSKCCFVPCSTFLFCLAEDIYQRWEEVPAAHPGAAEEGAQQLPGVTEAGIQTTQGAAQRGNTTAQWTSSPQHMVALSINQKIQTKHTQCILKLLFNTWCSYFFIFVDKDVGHNWGFYLSNCDIHELFCRDISTEVGVNNLPRPFF